jgi:WD40 repeat protein
MVWLLRFSGLLMLIVLAPSPLRAQQSGDARQLQVTAGVVLKDHAGPIKSPAFSPDGKLIATLSVDHTVRLWGVATGAEQAVLTHSTAVASVAFSPDSSLVVTASEDRTAHRQAGSGCSRASLSLR